MKNTSKRWFVRYIHLVMAIPILGYIYSPFEKVPDYAPATRFVFVPVMIVAGLWMWKGQFVKRLLRSNHQLKNIGAVHDNTSEICICIN